jgi:hypothetical protein
MKESKAVKTESLRQSKESFKNRWDRLEIHLFIHNLFRENRHNFGES